ncbi:MAG: sulfatase [Erysipelotrichaceae bacterium]|nr:sulfatase [Erysipelotrichaceae bacterium]
MNLIYINTHDTGRALSPYGYNVKTDNLLKLAQDSVLFSHAYCCNPTCSPSRAAMLTGTYPHQNGMYGLAQRGFDLNDPSKHLANFLKKHGYYTVISGIQHEAGWYLDLDEENTKKLGYEKILTTPTDYYDKHREFLHEWDNKNAIETSKWLDSYQSDKPFMLTYGLHSTHRPYPTINKDIVDERYVKPHQPLVANDINRTDEAQYKTTANYADENIGIVLDAIKRNGFYENSLIIFTTDHGVPLPFNKCFLNDNGIGVSLIMRVPQSPSNGVVIDKMVSHIDVFPTICDVLGLEKPDYLEGSSMIELLNDSEHSIRDYVFAELNFHTSYEPARCVRNERFKYVKYYDNDWTLLNLSNIDNSRPKDFLLEHDLRKIIKPKEALYDMLYDPLENNNIIDQDQYHAELVKLKKYMNDVQLKTNDPLLTHHIEIMPEYKVNKSECVNPSSKDPEDYILLK